MLPFEPASGAPPAPTAEASRRWPLPHAASRDLGVLPPAGPAHLLSHGSGRVVAPGTVVARAGRVVREVQVVVDGEVELKARVSGGRVTTQIVRAGGAIGDIPCLLGGPMPYDAIASRETELISLSCATWTRLITSSPSVALRWMTSIAQRLDEDRRRLAIITSKPLGGQIAYLLLSMCETDELGRPVAHLSQSTVAQLLGARRQSVTRLMGEMREAGLITTAYGSVLLVDPAGLRRVLGDDPLS